MLRHIKYCLFQIPILLLLVACYNATTDKRAVFHYNEFSGIASLDPAFAKNQSIMWAVHQLYNTLVEVDSSLHIVPSLAARWVVSPDGKTYTFYLRPDVFFHDDAVFPNGNVLRLAASDVVY